jgi:hypothetical protein
MMAPDLVRACSQQLSTYWLSRTILTNTVTVFDTVVVAAETTYMNAPGLTLLLLNLPT